MTRVLSALIYALTRLLQLSYRFRYENTEAIKALGEKNFILAIWHQVLLPGILAQNGHKYVVIISRSKDAEPVAYACEKLGHITTRGSSRKGSVDKGGRLAKEAMIKELKKGIPGAVTVDGPKGPAFEVKPGIIDMARESNSVIIPYAIAVDAYWEFKSWDRFRLPKPFSKILISYGGPVDVSDESIDHRSGLQATLNTQTRIAQEHLPHWQTYSRKNWWN